MLSPIAINLLLLTSISHAAVHPYLAQDHDERQGGWARGDYDGPPPDCDKTTIRTKTAISASLISSVAGSSSTLRAASSSAPTKSSSGISSSIATAKGGKTSSVPTKKISASVLSITTFTTTSTTSSAAPTRTQCYPFQDELIFFIPYNADEPSSYYVIGPSPVFDIITGEDGQIYYPDCQEDQNDPFSCEGGPFWLGSVPGNVDFQSVYVPSTGGALQIFIAGNVPTGYDPVTAHDFYCRNGTGFDVYPSDAVPVFKAYPDEAVQKPYQCGTELHLYATSAPTSCTTVSLQASIIPAA